MTVVEHQTGWFPEDGMCECSCKWMAFADTARDADLLTERHLAEVEQESKRATR